MNPEYQDRRQSAGSGHRAPQGVPRGAAYLNGRTRDFSVGGALVEVDPSPHVRAGDDVTLFVAWGPRDLLDERDGVPARVAHAMRADGGAMLGICFAQEEGAAGLKSAA